MLKNCKKSMMWLALVCWVFLGSTICHQNVSAEDLDLNVYYAASELDRYDNIYLTIPQNGRIRLRIENCTENAYSYYIFYNSTGSGSFKRDLARTTESYDGGWITVTPGKCSYFLYFWNLPKPNREARIIIDYQMSSKYSGETEWNDTYDDADNISFGTVYYGDYSKSGDSDIYKFSMQKPGNIKITMEGSLYDYTLYEEDSNGNVYEIKTVESKYYQFRIPVGNYFLNVNPREDSVQGYSLKVDATYESEAAYELESNNVSSQANNKLCNTWYTGNLNTSKDIDYFKFIVPQKSYLATEFKIPRGKISNCIQISLYDGKLNLLSNAKNTSNPYLITDEVLVNAGTYYVRVESGSSYWTNDDYSFSLKQREYIYVSQVNITGNKTITEKQTLQLSANVLPSNADNQDLKWSSSDKTIATVDSQGLVTAKKAGSVTITAAATDGSGVKASVTLQIREGISDKNPAKKMVEENKLRLLKSVTGENYAISISKTKVSGNGKAQQPAVTVKYKGKKLSSRYYTLKYSKNKYAGLATVTVTGTGSYATKIPRTKFQFVITPKKVQISSTKAGKASLKIGWQTEKSVSGYVVQVSTDKKFRSNVQEFSVKSSQKTKSVSGLKSKKYYYVRTRAYKNIQSRKFYGSWSSIQRIKTK